MDMPGSEKIHRRERVEVLYDWRIHHTCRIAIKMHSEHSPLLLPWVPLPGSFRLCPTGSESESIRLPKWEMNCQPLYVITAFHFNIWSTAYQVHWDCGIAFSVSIQTLLSKPWKLATSRHSPTPCPKEKHAPNAVYGRVPHHHWIYSW